MFSPLENKELDQWFHRLNAPLKRLPAEERAELHAEVRQHLEALAVAHEELGSAPEEAWQYALTQFGDPGKFGRRMRRQAMALSRDPNQWPYNPLLSAWIYVYAIYAAFLMVTLMLFMGCSSLLWTQFPTLSPDSLCWHVLNTVNALWLATGAAFVGWIAGRTLKQKAVTGTLLASFSQTGLAGCLLLTLDHDTAGGIFELSLSGIACLAAWTAKRGWYRPTLTEFKITLPSRTKQISR